MNTDQALETIFIVDDVVENLHLLTKVLSEHGYRIRAAKTGHEAIASIQSELPDLILLDVKLPDINGFDICKGLKLDPATRHIPIIFLSGLSDTADKLKGFEVGGVDYITKPFISDEVIVRVKMHLEMSRLRTELQNTAQDLKKKNKQLEEEIIERELATKKLAASITKLEESKQEAVNLLDDLRIEMELRVKNEAALRRSEERFQELFYNVRLCYQSLDETGCFLDVNQQWLDTLGFTREEVIGHHFGEFVSPAYRSGIREHFSVFKAQGHTRCAFEVVRKDGSLLYITLEGRIENDLNGSFKQTHCVLQDIAESRVMNETLKRNREDFKELFDKAPVGYHEIDADGRFVRVNETELNMLGYTSSELIGQYGWVISDNKEAAQRAVEAKLIGTIVSGEPYERNLLRKDGSIVSVLISDKTLKANDGKIVGIRSTVQDITVQKQVQEALVRSEALFSKAFHGSPAPMTIARQSDGTYIEVNNSFLRMIEYTREEVIGQTGASLNLIDSDARNKILQHLHKTGNLYGFEVDATSKSGKPLVILSSIEETVVAGEACTMTTMLDITERKQAEAELREKEVQYRNLANSGMALIWTAGIDTLCNYFNEPWLKFTGRTLEQEMGNGWAEGVHPDDFNYCLDVYLTAFNKREAFSMEYRLMHASGDYRWLIDMGTPNYNSLGEFIGYIGHCFDISDRKRIEEELSVEQSKQTAAFENSSMGFVISNAKGGDLKMNKTALRFHDFKSHKEMLKKVEDYENDWELYTPGGRLMKYEEWPLVRATHGDFVKNIELHYVNSKTQRKWICSLTSTPARNNVGDIIYIVQTLLDITEQKMMERSILRQSDRLRNLHEIDTSIILSQKTPEDIVRTGIINTGKLLACEQMFAAIPNYDKGEVHLISNVARKITIFERGSLISEKIFGNLSVLTQQKYIVEENMADSSTLTEIQRELFNRGVRSYVIQALISNEKLIGVLIFGWNKPLSFSKEIFEIISEVAGQITITIEQARLKKETELYAHGLEDLVRKRTELLEETNKELEAFSYSVSHDLRAPLRHINGYVELLLDRYNDVLPDKGKHYLDTIADSAQQMGTLIDDLLQFSRTGRKEINQAELDMNLLIKEVLDMIHQDLNGRKLDWKIAKLPTVVGDFNLLRLVWQNLLSNAVKFTRLSEAPRIEIGFSEEPNEYVFYVRDNGAGFDMLYAHKLFGVFQRLHASNEYEGTGIGLANVRRIINKHGGRVWAEAEIDKGATFYFTLIKYKENQLWSI